MNWSSKASLMLSVEKADKVMTFSIIQYDVGWVLSCNEGSKTEDVEKALGEVKQGLTVIGIYPSPIEAMGLAEIHANAWLN